MSAELLTQVAIAAGTVLAALFTLLAIKREMQKDARTGGEKRIKELASAEARDKTEPLKDRLALADQRIAQFGDRLLRLDTTLDRIDETLNKVRERIAAVEASTGQHMAEISMNIAKLLHQPDPRRAYVDHLLEAFMEGTLSEEERVDLKKVLVQIRNLEPGDGQVNTAIEELGYPVYPGEQIAAAILLGTMDLVTSRMSTYGHSMHRSVADKETSDDY